MENNEVLERVEDAIESDNLVVNYNVPVPTAKETLINTAIGAGVGLVCVGVVLGVGKVIDVAGQALYNRKVRKDRERQAKFEAEEAAKKNAEEAN